MSKITKIEIQKRNKERVNIFLNEEYAFSLSTELVYKEGLHVKDEVDEEKLRELASKDQMVKCKDAAIKLIEKSHKTEKQVRDKLLLKGYDDDKIIKAIDFLKQYNFLNDEHYAKLFVSDKVKSQGSNKIKYSLMQKGISKELIENELNNIDKDDEKSTAIVLGKKKLNVIRKSEEDQYKISSKLYRFLISKGYSYDIVKEVVKDIMSFECFD